jgi:hypothetical protein
MKVAIIGSRDYAWDMEGKKPSLENHYWVGKPRQCLLSESIYDAVEKLGPRDYVVSGGATGADYWGEVAAQNLRVSRTIHIPDWDEYGTAAGMIRNKLIIADADVVLAFFTDRSQSRGTVGSIGLAEKKNIPVFEFDASKEVTPAWLDGWYEAVIQYYEPGVA